jgi:hypothetical protein
MASKTGDRWVMGLGLAAAVGFLGFLGWAVWASSKQGSGWRGLIPIWPYVLGGVLVVGALTGGLMFLAFYSADHGYDEPLEPKDK